jgi:hypothetical protein
MNTYEANVWNYLYIFIENTENLTLKIFKKYKNNKEKIVNYIRFNTIDRLKQYRLEYITNKQIREERFSKYNEEKKILKQKQKIEELKKYNVWTLLYVSWGYEQTNVNFYQVTEKKGSKVYIKAISSRIVENQSSMSEYISPVANSFLTWEYYEKDNWWKIITANWIKVHFWHLRETTEKEKHFSSSRA